MTNSERHILKCFLINPDYPKKHKFLFPVPPLGLALIAAVMEEAGIQVKVKDQFATSESNPAIIKEVLGFHPDIVGIGSLTPSIGTAIEISVQLKMSGFNGLVIMGNIHPTIFADDLLKKNCCDIVVRGEGEETVAELIEAIKSKKPFEKIAGISFYNENGEVIHNPDRRQIENLDDLPLPAWHLFDLSLYHHIPLLQIYEKALPVQTSRGCPEKCVFCSQEHFFKKVRARSIESVMAELDFLVDRFKIDFFVFLDANFPIKKEYGLKFCECFKNSRHSGRLQWCTEIKVDMVDEELLSAMKAAGCYLIQYGFEVGDQKILNSIGKHTTIEKGQNAQELTKKAGIKTLGLFMIGLPGESYKEIFRTFIYACRLNCDMAKFNIAIPLPGSRLFERYKEKLLHNFEPETFSSSYRARRGEPHISCIPDGLSASQLTRLQTVGMLMFYLRPGYMLKQICSRSLPVSDMIKGGFFLIFEFIRNLIPFKD